MPKKIFVTQNVPGSGIQKLKDKGYEVTVSKKNGILSKKELTKELRAKQYDAVFCLLTNQIDAEIFDACPTAKIFANYAVGFNNIDLVEAKKRGITISNTPGEIIGEVVADHTFALLLALSSRIVESDAFVRKGKYIGWDPNLFIGSDLKGKILGLVGAGKIGQEVAHKAVAFGMRVIYYDVRRSEALEQEYKAEYFDKVEPVVAQADFVSLHVPLLDSTKHLMNEKTLGMMKPTAFLINTSRGPVVDEKALVDALKRKKIAGAGIDVFEFEPKLTRGLTKLRNIVMTPHTGSATVGAREFMSVTAAENIIAFFEGRIPPNAVK